MSDKEMADFLRELRNRHEMPIDEDEYYLIGEIAERLKVQESEENRILKIVWDVLHSTISVDTEADQDYVYELIRNQVRPMY